MRKLISLRYEGTLSQCPILCQNIYILGICTENPYGKSLGDNVYIQITTAGHETLATSESIIFPTVWARLFKTNDVVS